MMIVMTQGATEEQIAHVVERVEGAGARAHVSRGEFVTLIGAIGDDRELVASMQLESEEGVEKVVP
ncbi:MAG: 3-deoxy-7-phosphoheptulonate synthase, partial [Thermoleophilia bacterium]|nr:3-deoxy-7-phosphoheptulonate synthase [Thermoleophilia bacterium]